MIQQPNEKSIDSFRYVLHRFCTTKRHNGHAAAAIGHSIGYRQNRRLSQYTDSLFTIKYSEEPRLLIGGVNKEV